MALIKPEQLRSGSYNITGSLFGTSSYANYALTASFALNGGGGGNPFPHTGSAIISGSLVVTGSVKVPVFVIVDITGLVIVLFVSV